jgi:hypothetical protein
MLMRSTPNVQAHQTDPEPAETIVRIELGAEIDGPNGPSNHGTWQYSCARYPQISGHSQQPLLDACRQFKRLYGCTSQQQTAIGGVRVGLFREGRTTPDLFCVLDDGAAVTVSEPSRGAIGFRKFKAFDPSAFLPDLGECRP